MAPKQGRKRAQEEEYESSVAGDSAISPTKTKKKKSQASGPKDRTTNKKVKKSGGNPKKPSKPPKREAGPLIEPMTEAICPDLFMDASFDCHPLDKIAMVDIDSASAAIYLMAGPDGEAAYRSMWELEAAKPTRNTVWRTGISPKTPTSAITSPLRPRHLSKKPRLPTGRAGFVYLSHESNLIARSGTRKGGISMAPNQSKHTNGETSDGEISPSSLDQESSDDGTVGQKRHSEQSAGRATRLIIPTSKISIFRIQDPKPSSLR